MDVKTCKNCRRLFNYVAGPHLCPSCAEALEQKFQDVKSYVYDHRAATLQEISDENDVSIKQLKQWVREERLTFSEDSPVGLECEGCGAMIKTGRYCSNCKGKINNTLQSAIKKPDKAANTPKDFKDNKNRMRYLQ